MILSLSVFFCNSFLYFFILFEENTHYFLRSGLLHGCAHGPNFDFSAELSTLFSGFYAFFCLMSGFDGAY